MKTAQELNEIANKNIKETDPTNVSEVVHKIYKTCESVAIQGKKEYKFSCVTKTHKGYFFQEDSGGNGIEFSDLNLVLESLRNQGYVAEELPRSRGSNYISFKISWAQSIINKQEKKNDL